MHVVIAAAHTAMGAPSAAVGVPHAVHYLPVATTLLSAVFVGVLVRRRVIKGCGAHLSWWAVGVCFYGVGTALEASITLWGNTVVLNKAWYIAGALLGGYPLAQGTVYLLLQRKTAHRLTLATLPVIAAAALLVILSPVRADAMMPHKPGGAILAWRWVRLLTPPINTYAACFLVGGAALSAWRFARKRATAHRAAGNALIALGAMLPGIGGGMAKAGIVEGLYVGEFFGIILIWYGYNLCVARREVRNAVVKPAPT